MVQQKPLAVSVQPGGHLRVTASILGGGYAVPPDPSANAVDTLDTRDQTAVYYFNALYPGK